MSTDDHLDKEGWKMASISSGDHLRRTLAMYEELGIETYLEEVGPEECSGCRDCYRSGNETQYRLYVRRNRHREPGNQTI